MGSISLLIATGILDIWPKSRTTFTEENFNRDQEEQKRRNKQHKDRFPPKMNNWNKINGIKILKYESKTTKYLQLENKSNREKCYTQELSTNKYIQKLTKY